MEKIHIEEQRSKMSKKPTIEERANRTIIQVLVILLTCSSIAGGLAYYGNIHQDTQIQSLTQKYNEINGMITWECVNTTEVLENGFWEFRYNYALTNEEIKSFKDKSFKGYYNECHTSQDDDGFTTIDCVPSKRYCIRERNNFGQERDVYYELPMNTEAINYSYLGEEETLPLEEPYTGNLKHIDT